MFTNPDHNPVLSSLQAACGPPPDFKRPASFLKFLRFVFRKWSNRQNLA